MDELACSCSREVFASVMKSPHFGEPRIDRFHEVIDLVVNPFFPEYELGAFPAGSRTDDVGAVDRQSVTEQRVCPGSWKLALRLHFGVFGIHRIPGANDTGKEE